MSATSKEMRQVAGTAPVRQTTTTTTTPAATMAVRNIITSPPPSPTLAPWSPARRLPPQYGPPTCSLILTLPHFHTPAATPPLYQCPPYALPTTPPPTPMLTTLAVFAAPNISEASYLPYVSYGTNWTHSSCFSRSHVLCIYIRRAFSSAPSPCFPSPLRRLHLYHTPSFRRQPSLAPPTRLFSTSFIFGLHSLYPAADGYSNCARLVLYLKT